MQFGTRRQRERRRLRAQGFVPAWRELLADRMPAWGDLDQSLRLRLEGETLRLMIDKRWEAARGFELTDEIMATIAAQAALLVLGFDRDMYTNVGSILVHPTTLVARGPRQVVPGLVTDQVMPLAGQTDFRGPVVIVWDAVLADARHPRSGHNVVYHEFAHKLDMLEGAVDGTPPLDSTDQVAEWVSVCTDAYERVQRGVGGPVLRPYAGVNPGEFFAVATEAFFADPLRLREQEPRLYDVLARFYRQDPARRRLAATR